MKKTDKLALKSLEALYFYARDLLPRNCDRYDLGIKYTVLRDDLRDAINQRK